MNLRICTYCTLVGEGIPRPAPLLRDGLAGPFSFSVKDSVH
jgi:hypothetical protein